MGRVELLRAVSCVWLIPLVASPTHLRGQALVEGRVVDALLGGPVAGATVWCVGTDGEARTDEAGAFRLECPSRRLGVTASDREPSPPEVTAPLDGSGSELVIPVQMGVIRLDPLVAQGRHTRDVSTAWSRGVIVDGKGISGTPQLGGDLFRMLGRLPGMASSELSARTHIRGASSRETRVRLDGFELVAPYHLQDLDGALGTVDGHMLSDVRLLSGVLPVDLGSAGAGVVDLRTGGSGGEATPLEAGASLSVATVRSRGTFSGGRGEWLASGRFGYLDVLLALMNPRYWAEPRYHDALAKVGYQLGPSHLLSLHFLGTGDRLRFQEDDLGFRSRTSSGSQWARWHFQGRSGSEVETLLWATRRDRLRTGSRGSVEGEGLQPLRVRDDRSLAEWGLRQEWVHSLSRQVDLKWGGTLATSTARYGYDLSAARTRQNESAAHTPQNESDTRTPQSASATLSPSSRRAEGYVGFRANPMPPVTLEAGVRVAHATHADDLAILPRLHLGWGDVGRVRLWGGWGHYWNVEPVHEMAVEDGLRHFRRPQRSEVFTLGAQRTFSFMDLRAEGYHRRIRNPHPLALNLSARLLLLPETEPDRTHLDPERGTAEGLEVSIESVGEGPISWGANYALAQASDEVGGTTIHRAWDQRHAFTGDLSVDTDRGWRFTLAAHFRTGWPVTAPELVHALGEGSIPMEEVIPQVNRVRLPSYQRVDVRIGRRMALGKARLEFTLDVFNLFDRDNVAALVPAKPSAPPGSPRHTVSAEHFFPRLPSLEVTWTF